MRKKETAEIYILFYKTNDRCTGFVVCGVCVYGDCTTGMHTLDANDGTSYIFRTPLLRHLSCNTVTRIVYNLYIPTLL